MKKICTLIMVLIMMLSTTVCYGADQTSYVTKALYLKEMGVLTNVSNNPKPGDISTIIPVDRVTAAVVLARVMNATDPNWTKTDKHTFKDVPAWANQYVGSVVANGIMRGIDDNVFGPNDTVQVKDFTTALLRTMGYGYNDSVQEFTWEDSLKIALEVGLIDDDEYTSLKNKNELYKADMILLAYNAVKMCNNNPYTDEYLNELVGANPPSDEIKAFRNNDDPTREGYIRASFMYYDIYYPDTEEAKDCIKLLTPHANKAYAMLQDMYGIQPAFDVYLIPGSQLDTVTQSTAPGQRVITKNNHSTYIVLEKDQDMGGNNLGELVRELNNVFYDNIAGISAKRLTYTEKSLPWNVRTNMNMIGSLYTRFNYSGSVDQEDLFALPSMRSILRDNVYKSSTRAFSASSITNNGDYQTYYYAKMFSFKDTDDFSGCLKELANYAPDSQTTRSLSVNSVSGAPLPAFSSVMDLDKSFAQ